MHQREIFMPEFEREVAQPFQPCFADHPACGRSARFKQDFEEWLQFRRGSFQAGPRFGVPKHFIGVAQNAPPAFLYDEVNHLAWVAASVRQVAAVKYNVWLLLPEIGQHGIKRRQIAVNV